MNAEHRNTELVLKLLRETFTDPPRQDHPAARPPTIPADPESTLLLAIAEESSYGGISELSSPLSE